MQESKLNTTGSTHHNEELLKCNNWLKCFTKQTTSVIRKKSWSTTRLNPALRTNRILKSLSSRVSIWSPTTWQQISHTGQGLVLLRDKEPSLGGTNKGLSYPRKPTAHCSLCSDTKSPLYPHKLFYTEPCEIPNYALCQLCSSSRLFKQHLSTCWPPALQSRPWVNALSSLTAERHQERWPGINYLLSHDPCTAQQTILFSCEEVLLSFAGVGKGSVCG